METRRQLAYLVTTGSYSDYSVEAVFSTKEKAEAYLAERQRRSTLVRELGGYSFTDYNDIESMLLDPEITLGDKRAVWSVWFDAHGGVERARATDATDDTFSRIERDGRSVFTVHAHDENGAIKAAQEKRMRGIAETLGMT